MNNEEIKDLIEQKVQQQLQELVKNPLVVIKAYQEALTLANNQIAVMQPKAEFYDIVADTDSLFEMSAVSKLLNFKGMGRNNLFEYLRHKNIVRFNNEPYQKYVDTKCFKVVEQKYLMNGEYKVGKKTMITQRGIDFIAKQLLGDGYERNER